MKITIVTTVKNEGPHVLEWIAHHAAAGVTDFLIYTDDCSDGTEAILQHLPGVTHIPLPDGDKPPQWRALKAAWTHSAVQKADWVAVLDCDEFINLDSNLEGIPHLIDEVGGDAILLPWRFFGNAGECEYSAAPTTLRFTRAAPLDMLFPVIGSFFKTLFRRNGPFRELGVHRPRQKNPDRHPVPEWSDGSGNAISGALASTDTQIQNWGSEIARDLVQINHYSIRSAAEFMLKRDRGLPNHQEKELDLCYWIERNFNVVEDRTIEHMRQGTEDVVRRLLQIDGVGEAQERAVAWHAARLKELLLRPEELTLFGQLIIAGSSRPASRKQALALVQAYQVAHAS